MQWRRLGIALMLMALAVMPLSSFAKKSKKLKYPSWCYEEGYSCIRVKSGQSWTSLFPDEDDRAIVMRINHTNGSLWAGRIIKVPDNLGMTDLLDHAPFPKAIEPPDEKIVIFDPRKHAWGAYDADGTLVRWGPATGGKDWCSDIDEPCRTKAGTFRIYSLGSSRCVSSKFPLPDGGAPMPYCMFFNGGQALHGSPGGVIRGNASHGCVRLFVQDAEWLRYDFVEPPMASNRYRGTKVVVLPYEKPSEDDDEATPDNIY